MLIEKYENTILFSTLSLMYYATAIFAYLVTYY